MTVQLTTSDATLTSGEILDKDTVTDAYIGIDLTVLGAHEHHSEYDLGFDHVYASLPKLASCVSAACEGGLDLISLSRDFQARSEGASDMDAVKTMARLAQHGSAGFSAEVSAEPEKINRAVIELREQKDGWGAIEISVTPTTDLSGIAAELEAARTQGIHVCVRVEASDLEFIDHEELVTSADYVRLGTDDPHVARECRFALRSAARKCGSDIVVLVDLGVVISGNHQAANEREILLKAISGHTLFEGRARVVGTVYDVADEVERWIGNGAADGIVLLPASLPTDLASVIRGVMPLLRARGALSPSVS